MQLNFMCSARPLNVDQALVSTAAPVQRRIGKRLFKAAVHQNIDCVDQFKLFDLLPAVAGIQPDGLIRHSAPTVSRFAGNSGSPPENVTPET